MKQNKQNKGKKKMNLKSLRGKKILEYIEKNGFEVQWGLGCFVLYKKNSIGHFCAIIEEGEEDEIIGMFRIDLKDKIKK